MNRAFLLSAATIALAVSAEEPTVQTYPVRFTDPQEAAEIIQLMLPSTNHLQIQAIDRKLIVRGTAEQQKNVKQMLSELDAPPKNIQINVRFDSSESSVKRTARGYPRGPVTIRNGKIHATTGGRFRNQRTTVNETTTQMLVAMDGRSATLRVGKRVPYAAWLVEYGHRYGYTREAHIEWRDVGSFLAVEPTIVSPGLIRIRVIPELSGRLQDGSRKTIQFTHLATEVTAGDGQTIHIGGFNQDRDFNSHFFIGGSSDDESINTDITLTPHILE